MKKKALLALGMFLFLSATSIAQVSVNVNIGSRPAWVPVANNVDFYYFPDARVYYDVPRAEYLYYGHGRWVRARQLPVAYNRYDFYHCRRLPVAGYHGYAPYAYQHPRHGYYHQAYAPVRRVKHVKPQRYAYEPHGHHGKWHGRH